MIRKWFLFGITFFIQFNLSGQIIHSSPPDSILSFNTYYEWWIDSANYDYVASLAEIDELRIITEICRNHNSDTLFIGDFEFDNLNLPNGSIYLEVTKHRHFYSKIQDEYLVATYRGNVITANLADTINDWPESDSTTTYYLDSSSFYMDINADILNDSTFGFLYATSASDSFCLNAFINAVRLIVEELDSVKGQCIVEAGTNRNICPQEMNGAQLDGDVIRGNIVEYIWESSYEDPTLGELYSASSMLSDTSVLHPTIENHFDKTATFYLTGINNFNERCIDSVTINFSDWHYLDVDKVETKFPSDTIELWIAAESNWPHAQYEWSPNFMISDTTIQNPKVWNDTTMFYNLVITDSLGCSIMDEVFEVYVTPSSTETPADDYISIFPNPTDDIIRVEADLNIEVIEIYDLHGRLINRTQQNWVDLANEEAGIYLLKIKFENGHQQSRKIIKSNRP